MATQVVVYRGPAPSIEFQVGARAVRFERDVPLPVEDEEFVKRLLALNTVNDSVTDKDGKESVVQRRHTLEEAALYGTQVFELAGMTKPAKPVAEGVGA